jgi:GT2 family glycosyltransferase
MLTRSSVFSELGGFDEEIGIAYNDVDFCLRARRKGYLTVYTPYALLYHDEGGTRGRTGTTHPKVNEDLFRRRWGKYQDPYGNPNLDMDRPLNLRL